MTFCECGCESVVKEGNRFIRGHHTRTEEFRKAHNTPEAKEKHRQARIKYWSKPGVRERHGKTMKIVQSTPEVKENLRQGANERWDKPGAREEHSKIQKKVHNTPEAIENASQGAIKRWDNYTPEEKENHLRNGLYKGRLSPNISETKINAMLKPFGFHYNGKGPFSVGNKFPDFVHKTFSLLVEYDGDGGHNPNNPWVPDNQPQLDNLRDSIYHKAGYNVLRLLPEDLRAGKEFVQNKVKEWMVPILEKSVRSEQQK